MRHEHFMSNANMELFFSKKKFENSNTKFLCLQNEGTYNVINCTK
jgi:hypothetical protein